MSGLTPDELRAFVVDHLVVAGSCYFHCDQPTTFRWLDAGGKEVGLHHCPSGFISRIVYFDVEAEVDWFLSWVQSQVAPFEVSVRDVRVATRHPWEFGLTGPSGGGIEPYVLREVYWTQPRPSGGRIDVLYVCVGSREAEGCGSFFVQSRMEPAPHCPSCLKRLQRG